MNRTGFFLLLVCSILFNCESDSRAPYFPPSYALLPQSDLAVIHLYWHQCSLPVSPGKNMLSRGNMIWYNPYEMVGIDDIWPTIELSPDVPLRMHVLKFYLEPNKDIPSPTDSWNGIMLYLPDEFKSQLATFQSFEVTIKGDHGLVHFDIGEISEDVIPNGRLDSEDKPVMGIRNGLLDLGEDTGIDGMAGIDPEDWWDLNQNGIRDSGEPISYDDWEYNMGSSNYSKINGTEYNVRFVRTVDTEDLSGDSVLDTLNNYYEFTINLDKSSSDTTLISRSLPTNEMGGWYTYRIDLRTPSALIGNPNPWKLKFFRIWVTGLSTDSNIVVAAIDFK